MDGRLQYLRPSYSGRWSACGGYVSARVSAFDIGEAIGVDVVVREEGTACHWLAEQMLKQLPLPNVDDFSPNNVELVEPLWDAVDVYVDALRPLMGMDYQIESQINCSIIYEGMEGTGDFVGVDEDAKVIAIRDAKFGYRYVPEDTPQLTIYGGGVFDELGWDWEDPNITIDLGVVQPRVFGTEYDRSRILTAPELWREVQQLQHKAQIAMGDDAMLVAGPHCVDCELRWQCKALSRVAADACTAASVRTPDHLEPAQLAVELAILETYQKLLAERVTGLQQQAQWLIQQGHCVNNYEVVQSYGREKFSAELPELTRWAKQRYGVDTHVSKPLTPNQVRAALPPEARKEVDKYAYRPENGPVLQRMSVKSKRKLDKLIKAGNKHGR